MNENDFRELAAGHALNALSAEDERAFRAALADNPAWLPIVDIDLATASALADGTAEVVPAPAVRANVLSMIASLPQERSADASAEPAPRAPARRSRLWFALAASLAFILALGVGGLALGQLLAPNTTQVALEQIEQAPDASASTIELADGGTATAHWSASLGRAVLVTDGMPSLTDEQTYEMWFVRDGAALSAGTFDADDSGEATATLVGDFVPGDVIAVTVEADGGSPDGQPTTEPMFAITT